MSDKPFDLVNTETGHKSQLPVRESTLGPAGIDIGKLYATQGVFTYDPGFVGSMRCESAITYIDGEKGILLYRGYPIEQIATQSSFVEVCYLLLQGELPSAVQLEDFSDSIGRHTMINEALLRPRRQSLARTWCSAAPASASGYTGW